eukprot:749592-Hanusia_phi.AAC.1
MPVDSWTLAKVRVLTSAMPRHTSPFSSWTANLTAATRRTSSESSTRSSDPKASSGLPATHRARCTGPMPVGEER